MRYLRLASTTSSGTFDPDVRMFMLENRSFSVFHFTKRMKYAKNEAQMTHVVRIHERGLRSGFMLAMSGFGMNIRTRA